MWTRAVSTARSWGRFLARLRYRKGASHLAAQGAEKVMFNQTSLSVFAVVIAALTTGRPALAAETTPGHTGQAAAEPAVPQRANAAPAAPRPPAENPYRS